MLLLRGRGVGLNGGALTIWRGCSSHSSPPEDQGLLSAPGRYAVWQNPSRFGPEPFPLEDGPEFTYADGRPTPVSNERQIAKMNERLELNAEIIRLLGEMNEAESMFHKNVQQQQDNTQQYYNNKPKAKGVALTSIDSV